MAREKIAPKNDKGFEESLWDSANRLRGSVESSEYKHVVLSLIFLKFVSDKFEERRAELIAEGKEKYTDMVEFYTMKNVFYLPETSRWSHIQQHAKQGDIAIKIDSALTAVEKSNASLKGALPDNYFSRLGLDGGKLSALIDAINNIDTVEDKEEDVVGRVYEYFLGKFAASEGKLGGEFYTPKCVVNLIAEMIEPYKGKIYDPCCGSGGMFVQSLKFVQSHHGNTKDISVYGQEFTATTYKLAKMNLAVRGLSANLGEVPADSFFKDQHPDLKADYVMANPPFNMKDWRATDELVHDPRWNGYETPPTGNANYAWILHMVSKLSEHGVAGFVLANGSMSTNTSGEGAIRQKLVENDLVDCMIALPGQLFYTTQIPVCLWFLSKSKKADSERGYHNREGKTLFIDARKIGSMISRTQKELLADDIADIARTYHAWQGEAKDDVYENEAGYCKSATLEDIRKHDFVLTPGRYVGAAEIEDDGIPFETKMSEMSQTLYRQMKESAKLDEVIQKNLEVWVMESEWPIECLEELAHLIVDCPHSTPKWTSEGEIVLRNQNIRNGRLDLSSPSYTNTEGYLSRIKRAIPTTDDLILTREAPMGEVCIVPPGIRCCMGQRMVLIRTKKQRLFPQYLLYLIQSPFLQHQIGWNEGTGTTVSNIRIPNIKGFNIPVPPLPKQETIAHILGSLDDKIELNRRMNATLEGIAQALFKSWFVDFDPVIDNALVASNPIPCYDSGGNGLFTRSSKL